MENMFASDTITKSDRILHTPGSFTKNHLLYVQEVGKLQSLVPHTCKRENIDSYLIFEVLEGKGTITTEGRTTELHKGECVWIDCHNAFEHISSETDPWQLAWVHFNGNKAQEFYELFRSQNAFPVFTPLESLSVMKLILQILECLKKNTSELELHSLLTQLIVNCAIHPNEKDKMEEIREFININHTEKQLLEILSEKFSYSQDELERIFRKSYGIDIHDYIMNRRFNVAKELLRFTIQPVDEIAKKSGITDKDLFYRLFKENESLSPEEYRKNWAQWIKD